MIGTVVGNYRIEGFLGGGGMGAVYLGTDTVLRRQVAIKVLNRGLLQDETKLQAFRDEAMAQARLNHPNVATLYNLLELNGEYFMIMELVEGETLDSLLAREGALPLPRALSLFEQALQGFEHAHQRQIIHRDIKPGNLIITRNDQVKITDFGIARVLGSARKTKTGWFKGTYEYASPEQIRGQEQDERSDVYSLGVLFYQMVTGQLPFSSTSEFEIMRAHMEEPAPPIRAVIAALPADLEAIIAKSLAKSPDQRFASVGEFRAALHAIAPVSAPAGPAAAPRAPLPRAASAGSLPPNVTRVAGPPPQETRAGSAPPLAAPPPAGTPLSFSALQRVSPHVKSMGVRGAALGACLLAGLGIGGWLVQRAASPAETAPPPSASASLPAPRQTPEAPLSPASNPPAAPSAPEASAAETGGLTPPPSVPPPASAPSPPDARPTPPASTTSNPPPAAPHSQVKVSRLAAPAHHAAAKPVVHHTEAAHHAPPRSRPRYAGASHAPHHSGAGGSSSRSSHHAAPASADDQLQATIKHEVGGD